MAAAAAAVLIAISPGTAHAALPYTGACSTVANEQNPTANPTYGIPIRNQFTNGELTQGTSTVTNIDLAVCGLLQFPSLSATIPVPDFDYGVATATIGGAVAVGTVDITADAPSTAVTSDTPAPNGGLVFTFTDHAFNKINVGVDVVPSVSSLARPESAGLTLPGGVTVPSVTLPGGVTLPTVTLPGGVTLPTLPGITVPGGSVAAVSCDLTLDAKLSTAPSANSSPLVGSLATGATGVAFAPKGEVALSGLTPDPSSPLGPELCPIVAATLGVPSTNQATLSAPVTFYSTLTSF